MAKRFFSMFVMFMYALGSIGGFGYAIYSEAYVIATAVVVLAIMAFPQVKKHFNIFVN